jgi:S-formylglutathione hydrolase FrmB
MSDRDGTEHVGWAAVGPPWGHEWQGAFHDHVFESEVLAGNPLGDPHRRPLTVYTPPAYAQEPDRRFPVIYQIQGLTGQLDMWRNRKAFQKTVPETVDLAFSAPGQAPALVVSVDCWTSLGGSQFLDSPGTGRYLTYLCDEIIPWVDATYRTLPGARHRAVAGKSSGGYGAMVLPMLRPDRFGALATHAGDALFEVCYAPDIAKAVRTLRDKYDGSFDAFWTAFHARTTTIQSSDYDPLNMWCMAACYSADADGTVRIPFDLDTGELIPEIWDRWLANDPVRMVAGHADALRGLRGIWIDAGRKDEYFLDLGAEAFRRELDKIGVTAPIVQFELVEGTHSDLEHRYPMALAWLAERIA